MTTPPPRPGALPYLTVRGAAAASAWYGRVFGARPLGEPIVVDDGRVGHAELEFGSGEAAGPVYLADEFPELGLLAPAAGVASVSMVLPVADTDVVLARAAQAGGRIERWTYESHGQRNATLVDPFGHRWLLAAPLREGAPQGDVAALVLRVPDVAEAAAFYGAVLGWDLAVEGALARVRGTSRPVTVLGGHRSVALLCCHAVVDVEDCAARVAAAGGQVVGAVEVGAGEGLTLCADSTGLGFALVAAEPEAPRPPLNGEVPGDPAYLTIETPSLDQTCAFYQGVFGWEFTSDEGGIESVGTHPMTGAAAAGTGLVVPMWRVADARAAAALVAQAGGEVLAGPQERPYGVSALCRDNQGGRFYLGS